MLVGKPEFASHETVGVFWFGEISKHAVGIVVQRIDMIDEELALHARRILSHREIHASAQFLTISPYLHLPAERIDIQLEGLERHFVYASLLELSLKIHSCLIGTILGVAATLILGAAQFLNHSFIMCQVLRTNHCGRKQLYAGTNNKPAPMTHITIAAITSCFISYLLMLTVQRYEIIVVPPNFWDILYRFVTNYSCI